MEGSRHSVTGADGVTIGLLTAGTGPATGRLGHAFERGRRPRAR